MREVETHDRELDITTKFVESGWFGQIFIIQNIIIFYLAQHFSNRKVVRSLFRENNKKHNNECYFLQKKKL